MSFVDIKVNQPCPGTVKALVEVDKARYRLYGEFSIERTCDSMMLGWEPNFFIDSPP